MSVGFQKFYYSADPLALERSFLSDIISASKDNVIAPIHVLVPNHYVAAHLRHKFSEQQPLFNIRFVTWKELAKTALQSDPQFLSRTLLPKEMELFQIGNIAKKILCNTEFESVSAKKGFHQNLQNLFHHLIAESCTKIPHINLKTKLLDQIFQQYLELKNKHYHDAWLIESATKVGAIRNINHLYIFGLTKLNTLEIRFLTTLSQNTNINLWLERLFFEDLQETVFTWAGSSFEYTKDVGDGSHSSVNHSKKKTVTIQPTFHIQDEAIFSVQKIVEYMGDATRKFESVTDTSKRADIPSPSLHRIAIFLNDYSAQRSYFEQAFTRYNIAFVTFNGKPQTQTPLGKSLLCLTQILFQNWKRDEWMQCLQVFPFAKKFYQTMGTPDQWNEWSIDAQITTKNSFLIPRLEGLYQKNKNPQLKEFIAFQKKWISDLQSVEKNYHQGISLFFQSLWDWIIQYADPEFVLNEHAILFDEFIYFSKSVNQKSDWNEVKNIIIEKLSNSFVQEKTFESDGVWIAPISMMPGLSFDMIILPHLNEGFLPKNHPQAIDLSSKEQFQITTRSGVRFTSSEHEFENQRILFESAAKRADTLIVSYALYELPNQQEIRPSVFLQNLKKEPLFQNKIQPAIKPFIENNPFTQAIRAYHEALYANLWTNYNAFVSDKIDKEVYSSSDFSTYLVCPRKYFLSKVLKLSKEDHPEDLFEIDPMDKGNLIHSILFTLFSTLRSQNLFPLHKKNEAKILEMARSITLDAFQKFTNTHAYGSDEIWNIDQNELLQDVTAFIHEEIRTAFDWEPYAFEYRFGMKGYDNQDDPLSTDKAVTLPVIQKNLSFRGKVDRVDLSSDKQRMRIIDYKTGKKFEHVHWNYKKGENIQIPLYMLLAKYFFPEIAPTQVHGELVHLKSISNFDRRHLPSEQLSTKEQEILELLNLSDKGIQRGMFYPNPGNNMSNCKNCDFVMFCGSNIDRDIESIPPDEFMTDYQTGKDALR